MRERGYIGRHRRDERSQDRVERGGEMGATGDQGHVQAGSPSAGVDAAVSGDLLDTQVRSRPGTTR